MPDTPTRQPAEPDDGRARFNKRRLVRCVAILMVGIVAVLVLWQDPLYALLAT